MMLRKKKIIFLLVFFLGTLIAFPQEMPIHTSPPQPAPVITDPTGKDIFISYTIYNNSGGPTIGNREVRDCYAEGPPIQGTFKLFAIPKTKPKAETLLKLTKENLKKLLVFTLIKDGKEINIQPISDFKPTEYIDNFTNKIIFYYSYKIPISKLPPGKYDFYISFKTDQKVFYGYGDSNELTAKDYYKFKKINIKEAKSDIEKDNALWDFYTKGFDSQQDEKKTASKKVKLLLSFLNGKLKTKRFHEWTKDALVYEYAKLGNDKEAFAWYLAKFHHADHFGVYDGGEPELLWLYICLSEKNKIYKFKTNQLDGFIERAKEIEKKYDPEKKAYRDWATLKKDVLSWHANAQEHHYWKYLQKQQNSTNQK